MYLMLRPEKEIPITTKPFWSAANTNEIKLQSQENGVGLTLLYWFAEGNQWQPIGYVEFFYRTTANGLFVDIVDLTIQSMPGYLDRELIVRKILKFCYTLVGPFQLHDLFQDAVYPFGTKKQVNRRTVTLLSAGLPEAWETGSDVVKKIEGCMEVPAVLEIVKPYPPSIQHYFLSLYLRRQVQRQQLTNVLTEQIFTYAISLIKELKDPTMQAFATYNVVLYYKHLKASLVANLSTSFVVREYLPFILSLPGNLEITQIMWLDVFLYLLDQNQQERYLDLIQTLTKQSKQQYSLFWPEMITLYRQHFTGNVVRTVHAFFRTSAKTPWAQLRAAYVTQHPGNSIITDFRNNVVEKNYIPRLSTMQRFALRNYVPVVQMKPLRSLLGWSYGLSLIPFIALFARYGSLITQSDWLYLHADLRDPVLLAITFTSSVVLGGSFLFGALAVLRVAMRKLRGTKQSLSTLLLYGLAGFGALVMLWIVVLGFFVTTMGIGTQMFLGIRKESITIGFFDLPWKSVKTISVEKRSCTSSPCSTMEFKLIAENGSADTVIVQKNSCTVFKTIRDIASEKHIPFSANTDLTTLSKECE